MNELSKGEAGAFGRYEDWSPHLTAWMDEYEKRLIAIAYGILSDNQLALDCVQEAFIKAGLNAHKLRQNDLVFPWLARIVVNQCVSSLRRSRRETTTDKIDVRVYEEKYPSDSEIWQAVNRLPDKLRIPTILFYYHDLSMDDISSVLGLNAATCRVRLHRARIKLKKIVEGDINE